ncbi:MAG: hypothetical protein HY216_10410 [Candidatus Rokubacteria bacterium]|nr:hypothetical protein [Candidatus Rokubacteria bacterium]
MRLLGWLLVALAFFYAVYAGFTTIWSYVEVANAVERAAETTAKMTDDRSARVKGLILTGALQSGISLDDRLVGVTDRDRTILVHVRWHHPVIAWGGEAIISVPLSLERTYGPGRFF